MADLILLDGQAGNWNDIEAALTKTEEPGAMRIDDLFKPEILDVQKRRNLFGQRIKDTPATGQPSRWIEKDKLPDGQGWVEPEKLNAPAGGKPKRTPHYLEIKALMGAMDNNLFNVEVTKQQGIFPRQADEDFADAVDAFLQVHDEALWVGAAPDPTTPADDTTPATMQYCGVIPQLIAGANQFTASVTAGTSIVAAFRLKVAEMVAMQNVKLRPTCSYWAPMAYHFLTEEMDAKNQKFNQMNIQPGTTVDAIMTAAGLIPVLVDDFMGEVTIAVDGDAWPVAILNEPLIEYHYITTTDVRIFELGLADGLVRKRVLLKFGAPGVKRPKDGHALLKVAKNWTPPA